MSYASLERPDTEGEQLLGDLTIQALQKKAQALGVDEAELDDAEEKAELVALIGAAQAAQPGADDAAQELAEKAEAARVAQLRTELEGTKLRALQKRARQAEGRRVSVAHPSAGLVRKPTQEKSRRCLGVILQAGLRYQVLRRPQSTR